MVAGMVTVVTLLLVGFTYCTVPAVLVATFVTLYTAFVFLSVKTVPFFTVGLPVGTGVACVPAV